MCSEFYVDILGVDFAKCFAPEIQSLLVDISRNIFELIFWWIVRKFFKTLVGTYLPAYEDKYNVHISRIMSIYIL